VRNPLIRPRGGLLRRGGGLITPGGGLLRVPASSAEALPTTVAELYAHSDPAQAIIDLMIYATLPGYLWLGNVADGAWIDVRTGLSMAKVSTPLFEQAESRFGGADSVEFDGTADGFIDSVNDGSLEIGSGDYQMISIFGMNSNATGYLQSKYDSRGFRHFSLTDGYMYHTLAGSLAATSAVISVDHGTVNPQTLLCTRSSAGLKTLSREGSASTATNAGDATTVSSTALKFGTGPSSAMLSNHAIKALWIGTGDLTETERLALATGLGLE
jgi:hypothetical protein